MTCLPPKTSLVVMLLGLRIGVMNGQEDKNDGADHQRLSYSALGYQQPAPEAILTAATNNEILVLWAGQNRHYRF